MFLLPQSATDFVLFADEKVFMVASPDNRQNDRVYAPRDTLPLSASPNVQQVADFIQENSYAFTCLNISNMIIFIHRKCTIGSTQIEE